MKIERISDNQIRCTLNKEDLEGKETLLSELGFGSEKWSRDYFLDKVCFIYLFIIFYWEDDFFGSDNREAYEF